MSRKVGKQSGYTALSLPKLGGIQEELIYRRCLVNNAVKQSMRHFEDSLQVSLSE